MSDELKSSGGRKMWILFLSGRHNILRVSAAIRICIKGYTTIKLNKTTDKYSYFLMKILPNRRLNPLRKPEELPYFCWNKPQETDGKLIF